MSPYGLWTYIPTCYNVWNKRAHTYVSPCDLLSYIPICYNICNKRAHKYVSPYDLLLYLPTYYNICNIRAYKYVSPYDLLLYIPTYLNIGNIRAHKFVSPYVLLKISQHSIISWMHKGSSSCKPLWYVTFLWPQIMSLFQIAIKCVKIQILMWVFHSNVCLIIMYVVMQKSDFANFGVWALMFC